MAEREYDTKRLIYRAKAYFNHPVNPGRNTILYSGFATEEDAHELLNHLLTLPHVTGGHLERHVQGIGWVVSGTEDDDEPDVRQHA